MHKVGILIPTKDRSDFLNRQLDYYASVESPHPIYIGDASNSEHSSKIKLKIKELSSKLNIKYFYWSNCEPHQTLKRLGHENQEKFCAFTGDDDFFIPDSITKCAEFLDRNSSYRTAQGKGIHFSLNEPGAFGAINSLGNYWIRIESEEETASDRILNFAQNYWVPQFSVHRKNEFINDSENYGNDIDKSFGELLHSFTFIIKGKSKFIDCLYLIRQGHDDQYSLPDTFDWVSDVKWQSSCEKFMRYLTYEIAKEDNITEKKARRLVKQSLWLYLSRTMSIKYKSKYKINRSTFKHKIKKIPMFSNLAKEIKNRFDKDQLNLANLMRPSSNYHKDFFPVYKAITKNLIR